MRSQGAVCFAILVNASTLCTGQSAEAPAARVSSGVMARKVITKVVPVMPQAALDRKVNGAVVMHVIIGADGRVETATVVSGPEMLRASFLAAVKQWVYMPFYLNGQAVRVDTTVTLSLNMGAPAQPLHPMPAGANGNGDGPKSPLQVQDRVRIPSGVMMGQLLKKVNPVYPPIPQGENVSGAIIMHVVVGKDGKVLEATVISGPQFLRANALAAVQQWEYRPYLLEGVPAEVDTTVTLNIGFGG